MQQTTLLVDLVRQNTELTATIKSLTERVEKLTTDVHAQVIKFLDDPLPPAPANCYNRRPITKVPAMRIWIFSGTMALTLVLAIATLAAPARAADDDLVRGFLASCDAGDNACLMDVVSGVQQAEYARHACPAYDKEAADVRNEVMAALKSDIAKTPAIADQKPTRPVRRFPRFIPVRRRGNCACLFRWPRP